MQGKKIKTNTKPNHDEPSQNFTKTLIPSVSPAEKAFQKPILTLQPNSNLRLFRKNQLMCKEKNLGQHGPYAMYFSSWSMETAPAFLSTSHLKHTSGCELHTRLYAFSFQTLSFPLYMLEAILNF